MTVASLLGAAVSAGLVAAIIGAAVGLVTIFGLLFRFFVKLGRAATLWEEVGEQFRPDPRGIRPTLPQRVASIEKKVDELVAAKRNGQT